MANNADVLPLPEYTHADFTETMKKTFRSIIPLIVTLLLLPSLSFGVKQLSSHEKILRQERQYLVQLDKNPADVQTRKQLAELYSRKNNWQKASQQYQRALAAGGQQPTIFIGLAMCQQQMNHIDQAIQTCLQGIAANPDNAELHLWLGNLYHAVGKNGEAEDEYHLCRQLNR